MVGKLGNFSSKLLQSTILKEFYLLQPYLSFDNLLINKY